MEKIDFLSSGSSNDSKLLLACANGIPYAIRLCTNCCSTTATSYINLATGVSSTTPPSGLSIGECADITCPPIYETESFVATAGQTSFSLSHSPYKDVDFTRNGATLIDTVAVVNGNTVTYVPSENNNINLLANDDITISYLYLDPSCTEFSINSVICFDFVEGGVTTNIKVVSINNAITYYENGVKISDSARITEVEQLVVNANADNVVCCPDCTPSPNSDPPNSNICYEFTTGDGGGGGGETTIEVNGWYNAVSFEDGTVTPGQRIEIVRIGPSPGVPLTTPILLSASSPTPESIASVQAAAEGEMLTRVKAVIPNIDTVLVILKTYGSGERVWQFLFYDSANLLRDYTGTCAYDPDGCPALGFWRAQDGGQVGENRGGALEEEPITISSGGGGGGTTTSIKVITLNGVTTYYENGTEVTDSIRIEEIEDLIAAATTSNVVCCPDCGSDTTADGSETKITGCAGTTITGTGTTADPYIICATAADGSETKVVAGTGTTVTGTGTTADPYIVSSTGGTLENVYFSTTDPNTAGTTFSPNTPQDLNKLYVSDVDGSTWIWNGTAYVSKTDNLKWQAIGNFAQVNKSGQGAVGSNTLITWEGTVNSWGSLVQPQLATETLLLKAGYVYEVDVALQATFANSGSWVNYAIFSGSTAVSQTTQVGTPGKIRPNTETFGPGMYDVNAKGYVRALTDTYISVKTTNGNATALNSYEGATYFTAKVIGVL